MFTRLALILVLLQPCAAIWWSLGLLSKSVDNEQFCASLTFLTAAQREFCATNSKIFSIIHRSLRLALDECRYQFRHSRWNCSIFDRSSDVGKLALKKTPESAFVYALTSASVMHHVAKTCARGELKECGCAKAPLQRSTNQSHDGFEWGGCSDDLKFGRSISSTFLDAEENDRRRRKLVRLINWHNNEAGRQAVERNVQLTCKCHGVSGSCTLRVCWRTLPDFRLVGSELRTKYSNAAQIRLERKSSSTNFNQTELIYVQRSPTFCEKDRQTTRFVTEGRQCHMNAHQPGSCAHLCCERGHRTLVRTIEEDCQCEFHWCCEVRCQRCVRKIEEHFCR